MISRYLDNTIQYIWSDQYKYNMWSRYERIYLNSLLTDMNIPAPSIGAAPIINLEKVKEYELITKHELVAFLLDFNEQTARKYSGDPNYENLSKYLHYGLTSSDVIDTVFSFQLKQSIGHCESLLADLLFQIEKKIEETCTLTSVGRTHGKHAEIIMFSDRFELFRQEVLFCLDAFQKAKQNLFGKCSGTVGTSSKVNLRAAETVLNYFTLEPAPTTTQVVPRLYYQDTMHASAMLASAFERFTTMVRLSSIDEIDELQEGFSAGQAGSSAMPHKKNPVSSENICGLCRLIKSNYQVSLSNNNLWWERDISHSSIERIIWPQNFHLLAYTIVRLTNLLKNLVINETSIQNNLNNANGLLSHTQLLEKSLQTDRMKAYKTVQEEYL